MDDPEELIELDMDVVIENNEDDIKVVVRVGPCDSMQHAYIIAEELYMLLNHRSHDQEFLH